MLEPAASLGSADERAEHQFQDRPLAEGIGDDFEAPALLDEETLEQIRGSNPTPMRHWEAQMGDARFEVIPEARHCPVMLAAVVGHDASGKLAGNRTALGGGVRPDHPTPSGRPPVTQLSECSASGRS
jgi:hypothetical protein